jgi:polar amino acid transport system permease protein
VLAHSVSALGLRLGIPSLPQRVLGHDQRSSSTYSAHRIGGAGRDQDRLSLSDSGESAQNSNTARFARLVILPQGDPQGDAGALMNGSFAMQKDVGSSPVLGAIDALRAAQIETASSISTSPLHCCRGCFFFVLLALHMIRLTDWYGSHAGEGNRPDRSYERDGWPE